MFLAIIQQPLITLFHRRIWWSPSPRGHSNPTISHWARIWKSLTKLQSSPSWQLEAQATPSCLHLQPLWTPSQQTITTTSIMPEQAISFIMPHLSTLLCLWNSEISCQARIIQQNKQSRAIMRLKILVAPSRDRPRIKTAWRMVRSPLQLLDRFCANRALPSKRAHPCPLKVPKQLLTNLTTRQLRPWWRTIRPITSRIVTWTRVFKSRGLAIILEASTIGSQWWPLLLPLLL